MTAQPLAAELPVLHRLVIVYLMLPVVVWLLGYFHWWFGVPTAALLVAGLWRALGGSWRGAPTLATFLLLLTALGWVMMTAAGGFLDVSVGDWNKHRMILTDLAHRSWPVHLPDPLVAFMVPEARNPDALLRYYMGYYIVPGLFGRWFGTGALNWAVPLWTWAGVALFLLLFMRSFARIRAGIAAVVLLGFSGMDFLRILVLSGEVTPLFSSSHIETDDFLLYRIQYPSLTTTLMWAPQHFIAGGLYSMLLLQLRSQPRFLACSGILLATCLFWSPFVAAGLLPFLALLVLDNGVRPFLRWQNFLLAGPLAGLLVAFLTSGTSEIVRGWLWQKSDWGELALWLPVFYLTEFVVLSLLLWRCRPQLLQERFFVASVLTLLILPVYTYGYFNDLGMRGSLPALMILCWYCAQVVSNHLTSGANVPNPRQRREHAKRQQQGRAKRRQRSNVRSAALKRTVPEPTGTQRNRVRTALVCLLVAVLVVGAVTPLHELMRAFENVGSFRYQKELTSISVNNPRPAWTQFVANVNEVPAALRSLLKPHEQSARGHWEPVLRSKFDVFRNGKMLAYTKTPCVEEEDLEPLFFLSLWPRYARDLPAHRRQRGFETRLYPDARIFALWQGEKCALIRKLPEYDIERVVTGQLGGGGSIWRGVIPLAQPSSSGDGGGSR